ncbi:hypothetical protein, partial [Vibrio sp. 10N.222.52.B7]|uniref:hypothetical protein n=1 Tax=Vibrio sp. 10N.222.52.B7 TaxID=3229629 RepID=UPI00354B11B7
PGESDVARVGEILISLEELDLKLSEAVVGENYQNSKNMLPSEDEEEEGEDGEFVQSLTRDEEEEDETPNKTKGIKSSRIKQ